MKNLIIFLTAIILFIIFFFLLSPYPVLLGGVAAWVTTGSFLLQVIHIIKNKEIRALSIWMWSALFLGVSCWFTYGMKTGDIPVMTANGITAILASVVIILKIWNERPVENINPIKVRKMKNVVMKMRVKQIYRIKKVK